MRRTPSRKVREANATDWQPPPGMLKRQCLTCGLWFAAKPALQEPPRCHECSTPSRRHETSFAEWVGESRNTLYRRHDKYDPE